MNDYENIENKTLEELAIDYDYDISQFMKSLDSRIKTGEYFNKKYSFIFKPFQVDYFRQQKDILINLSKKNIDDLENRKLVDKDSQFDIINKSPHYNHGKYECIEVMKDVFGEDRLKTWCILNAFKYLYRCYYKNGDQDLEKATYYLNYIKNNLLNKKEKN